MPPSGAGPFVLERLRIGIFAPFATDRALPPLRHPGPDPGSRFVPEAKKEQARIKSAATDHAAGERSG
ncbi:hypothetical protein SPHINGO8AM_130038 [Sphingomonas sp. 8AM]|nr:hypothetical protein SPHINGO8AM_130038 [Sphingomonas sp. 8AM]